MNVIQGDIIWVVFPFTDLSSSKLRPALVLSNSEVNKTGDIICMQVTSNLRNDKFSYPLQTENFKESPLLKSGELRLHKIFVIHRSLIKSFITAIKEDSLADIKLQLNKKVL
jgi:mRNA interferase MazF